MGNINTSSGRNSEKKKREENVVKLAIPRETRKTILLLGPSKSEICSLRKYLMGTTDVEESTNGREGKEISSHTLKNRNFLAQDWKSNPKILCDAMKDSKPDPEFAMKFAKSFYRKGRSVDWKLNQEAVLNAVLRNCDLTVVETPGISGDSGMDGVTQILLLFQEIQMLRKEGAEITTVVLVLDAGKHFEGNKLKLYLSYYKKMFGDVFDSNFVVVFTHFAQNKGWKFSRCQEWQKIKLQELSQITKKYRDLGIMNKQEFEEWTDCYIQYLQELDSVLFRLLYGHVKFIQKHLQMQYLPTFFSVDCEYHKNCRYGYPRNCATAMRNLILDRASSFPPMNLKRVVFPKIPGILHLDSVDITVLERKVGDLTKTFVSTLNRDQAKIATDWAKKIGQILGAEKELDEVCVELGEIDRDSLIKIGKVIPFGGSSIFESINWKTVVFDGKGENGFPCVISSAKVSGGIINWEMPKGKFCWKGRCLPYFLHFKLTCEVTFFAQKREFYRKRIEELMKKMISKKSNVNKLKGELNEIMKKDLGMGSQLIKYEDEIIANEKKILSLRKDTITMSECLKYIQRLKQEHLNKETEKKEELNLDEIIVVEP